jgi:quercetin dioxygenase-like cupin family protein
MTTDDELDEIASEVLELGNLIDYQTGATVSRTLVDRETATLTVFAFDEGESLSEHTAPHDALLQVLEGTATITIDGEDYELEGGESIVMPANVPHAVAADTRFKMFLTMVR